MTTDYPDVRRGTRWSDIPARQWRNLTDDVEGPATIQAGAGILVNRVSGHFNLSIWPSILQLLTRKTPMPMVGAGTIEKFQVMNEIDRGDGPHIMQDDYFYAKRLSTGDTRIKIAKPHKLRTTPWDTHLRQKAGLGAEVYLEYYDVRVTYIYPQRLFEPLDFNKRWATRDDEANIRAVQIIWPAYGTHISPDTPLDIIKAVQIGEEATGIEGIEWEDMNDSGRDWSLFPQAFESPASTEEPQ